MKQRSYLLLLLAAVLGTAFTTSRQGGDTVCLAKMRELLAAYGDILESDALYLHYRQWQAQGDVAGPVSEHRMWTKGNRMRYENEAYGFIQDGHTQIVIDHGSQTIVLQAQVATDAGQGADLRGFLSMPIGQQADSIAAIASAVRCESTGRIVLEFPHTLKGQTQPLKQLLCAYDPIAKRMLRQVYTYYAAEEGSAEVQDTYLYDAMSNFVADSDLPGDGLTLIYKDKQLLPAYQGYEVMDLRAQK